jgi:hypothetical protein
MYIIKLVVVWSGILVTAAGDAKSGCYSVRH